MDKKTVLKTIRLFRQSLEKQGVRINRLILYGSWATNRAHRDSDIDLVVVSRDFAKMGFWQRNSILAPIEAVAMTPQEWKSRRSFVCEYAKDGVTL